MPSVGTETRGELVERIRNLAARTGEVSTLHNRAAAELAGVHPTDWDCIDVLHARGPMCASELAAHTGLTSGAITGVVDRLEHGGFAYREPDPSDRRRVMVRLVEPCREDLVDVFAALEDEVTRVIEGFGDDDLRVIARFLEQANAVVETSTGRFRAATESERKAERV